MGQYYTIGAPETGTAIRPYPLGAMLKMAEHVYNDGPKMAISLLCASGFGSHPRDLPWANIGQWAGKALLATGDYAEKNDLKGREAFLGDYDALYNTGKDAPLDVRLARRKTQYCLSKALLPVIERATNLRASGFTQEGQEVSNFINLIPVTQTTQGWDIDVSDLDEKDRKETLEYYGRVMDGNLDRIKRDPITMENAPNTVPAKSEGTGGNALWVSFDRMEYIDCAQMGEDDLIDVVNGESARVVTAMLFHHDRRGGGDIPDLGPITVTGRWRGDRIALVGPNGIKVGRKTYTQEMIKQTMRDITDLAYMNANIDTLLGKEVWETVVKPQPACQQADNALDTIIAMCKIHKDLAYTIDDCEGELSLPVSSTYGPTIPASFTLYLKGKEQRVWLPADIMAKVNPILDGLTAVDMETADQGRQGVVVANNRYTWSVDTITKHRLMKVLHDTTVA